MLYLLFLPSKSEGFKGNRSCCEYHHLFTRLWCYEWINHNENGFIANSYDDVVQIVSILKKDSDLLFVLNQ